MGRRKKSCTIVPDRLEDVHTLCNRCTGEPLIIWHAIKEISRRHVGVQHWPAVPTEPKNGGEVYIRHDNHSWW
jgi:H2-forming N5,N10-methylenetetrahydromethanopterin dehydrogenase-like enzyme